MLFGDSHAEQLIPPMQQLAAREGWNLRVETRSGCGVFGVSRDALQQDADRCVEWSEQEVRAIESDPTISTVVIVIRSDLVVGEPDPAPILSRLRDAGKQVIVFRDLPTVELFDAQGKRMTGPACLAAQESRDDACSWEAAQDLDWLTAAAHQLDIDVVDLQDLLCPDGTCHMITGDLVVYTDDNHFTGTFAKSLTGWLQRELVPLVK
ncbi:hypothetical protein G7067_04590 [Leucobacter insecticola]|uniref:SGNH domain-containing protein n=2 Tax=Leucobacter insecticola TaxID=2714934 RepID=A0A6G8FHL1_9MICO|nr:hypothetical protein G7067_04590 [Leucobacter insecticola]